MPGIDFFTLGQNASSAPLEGEKKGGSVEPIPKVLFVSDVDCYTRTISDVFFNLP